ncbi:MAG: ExeA family protein [Planctomycetaceae bacterium]
MHIPSRHPSSRPFMAAPRTQFYHPATQIDAALKSVERCIRRGEGMALVVGPPGTGKSLLLAMVAEHIRDDFDVALLSGASICTRRALWQSIMEAIGEPFRGIDESDLRMAIVERIRALAAAGSGLVILVDEAATLPTRLIEELRLLTNVPTPLPAVHIVLAGGLRLEELLAAPRMECLAQRVAVRGYLEPLDHAETTAYLRSQTRSAGLEWERLFAPGSDDAVFRATDGVPRLINQLCDHALVLVAECNRQVTAADIAAAWREIQRLPPPSGVEPMAARASGDGPAALQAPLPPIDFGDERLEMIEFGAGDEPPVAAASHAGAHDPWSGPDIEVVAGHGEDPFAALFREDAASDPAAATAQSWNDGGPDDFRGRPHVRSREGQAIGRLLASLAGSGVEQPPPPQPEAAPARHTSGVGRDDAGPVDDDADMVVVVDDADDADVLARGVAAVRPDDYRSLFTRLRYGSRRSS